MSHQEVDRLAVIQSVVSKQLGQFDAAEQPGLSIRQIKRLVQSYRQNGAAGLVSGHRGKQANNAIPADIRQASMSLIRRQYTNFSPTFAHEKLTEVHGFSYSVETLRQWMIAEGLWQTKL